MHAVCRKRKAKTNTPNVYDFPIERLRYHQPPFSKWQFLSVPYNHSPIFVETPVSVFLFNDPCISHWVDFLNESFILGRGTPAVVCRGRKRVADLHKKLGCRNFVVARSKMLYFEVYSTLCTESKCILGAINLQMWARVLLEYSFKKNYWRVFENYHMLSRKFSYRPSVSDDPSSFEALRQIIFY